MIEKLYELYRKHPVVTTDSRRIEPGSLFFALRGENFDGNRFAADALRQGAAYCIVDDPAAAADPRCLPVDDVLGTLQQLGLHHRRRLGIPVIALTGSNGKTTTKELIRSVLEKKFRVAYTRGNLNNHIGIPLTLLSIRPEDQIAVVEMGANHRGEIASYCRYTEPDYGLITNIGKAHLEGFGGLSGIRQGKGELFDYLHRAGGTAFCNLDDPAVTGIARRYPDLKTVSYGTDGMEASLSPRNELTLRYQGVSVASHLVGGYNAANIAAAIAFGEYFGVPLQRIAEGIGGYVPENFRSQRVEAGSNVLYLDMYNANPSSMEAAVRNFLEVDERVPRKMAILGDMLELGEQSAEEHRKIVGLTSSLG